MNAKTLKKDSMDDIKALIRKQSQSKMQALADQIDRDLSAAAAAEKSEMKPKEVV